jgi:hypothetical protein
MDYRPEVDGLRTVAVVPVILFHAGLPGRGGDVCFKHRVLETERILRERLRIETAAAYLEPLDRRAILRRFSVAVVGAFRLGKERLLASLITLFSFSLMFAVWTSTAKPSVGFFLSPSRFWELLVGSILAALHFYETPRPNGMWAQIMSAFGLAAILVSVVVFDSQTPFPSLYTLAPTVGTALIIHAATGQTIVGTLLSSRPMVSIGLLSYSAYLWHQPLFAFARLFFYGEAQPWVFAVLTALTFVLAAVSLRLVEAPFRKRDRVTTRQVWALTASTGILLIGVGVAGHLTKGLQSRFSSEALRSMQPVADRAEFVEHRHKAIETAPDVVGRDGKNLLIIGDSFSEDFLNVVQEAGAFPGFNIQMTFLYAACGTYWGDENVDEFVAPVERSKCRAARKQTLERLRRLLPQATVVVFASVWKPWAAERLGRHFRSSSLRPKHRSMSWVAKILGTSRRCATQR